MTVQITRSIAKNSLFLLLVATPIFAPANPVVIGQQVGDVQIRDWKSLKNVGVTRQNFDFSCGASSVATILNHFYDYQITEKQIMQDMNKADGMANFDDMAKVVEQYGFRGQGIATNFEQLQQIKVPAIVYLNYQKNDHFSVLKSITSTHVTLADPSWGLRTLRADEFVAMWRTRSDPVYYGKVLLILPTSDAAKNKAISSYTIPTSSSLLLTLLPTEFRNFNR